MDFASKYEFEIWQGPSILGDITRLVQNVRFSLQRNEAETLEFTIDTTAFDEYSDDLGVEGVTLLNPYVIDVKVKRNGEYLFGTQIIDMRGTFTDARAQTPIRCTGYLNLMLDRYVTKSYAATDASQMAWDLINTSQADPYGDFGITKSTDQFYNTGIYRERTYSLQNVKEGIINLTELVDGRFDFRFTHERVFETYEKLGSDRSDISFQFPGDIISLNVPKSAISLYNHIIGIGSGFGDEALRSEAVDSNSAMNYGLRQRQVNWNNVSEQATLNHNTLGELYARKDLFVLPEVTLDGSVFDLNDVSIGDRIRIVNTKSNLYRLNGIYRIERIDVSLDENQAETIKLTLDDHYL